MHGRNPFRPCSDSGWRHRVQSTTAGSTFARTFCFCFIYYIGCWSPRRGFRAETVTLYGMSGSSSSELPVLYLTTVGRKSGLPRQIEIWFVAREGRYYLLAEHFHRAQWVQNIERNPRVQVRLGGVERQATARILDETGDAELWNLVQGLGRSKYGWGDGLPVELTPDAPF